MNQPNFNSSKKDFCKVYSEYNDERITHIDQMRKRTFDGRELHDFCDFYAERTYKYRLRTKVIVINMIMLLIGAAAAFFIYITLNQPL